MFADLLEKLRRHQDLSSDEAARAMGAIMDGEAQPSQIAGLADGPGAQGRAAGRDGRASRRAMRERAVRARRATRARRVRHLRDGRRRRAHVQRLDRRGARASPACGVRVAKHGNRAVVEPMRQRRRLRGAGRRPRGAARRAWLAALDDAGLAFFFAPAWHPSMRHAAPTRRELGVRTAFNLLGPLTNPARRDAGSSSACRSPSTPSSSHARSAQLGSERAWVVHGADGLDEISTTGHTKVSECRDGTVNTFYVHPADVGLPRRPRSRICAAARRRRTRR